MNEFNYDIIYPVPSSQAEELIDFIRKYWKSNHVFVLNRELFDFQHYNKHNNTYNFVIARNKSTQEIDALIGYIPVAQYDFSLSNEGDYWSAIWKKRSDIVNDDLPFASLHIYEQTFNFPGQQSEGAISISKIALKIDTKYGCKIDYLKQYYILNDRCNEFNIAANVQIVSAEHSDNNYRLIYTENPDWNNINIRGYYRPLKSTTYFINRFSKHPIYKYSFIEVYNNSTLEAVLAVRVIAVNGSKCVRIVDVLGKLPEANLICEFREILYKLNAEYIDILNYGISEQVFYTEGFSLLDLNGDTIIPNYFEPFEQRNVKFDIAYKAKYDNYVAFKADSDQDRPNIISENYEFK